MKIMKVENIKNGTDLKLWREARSPYLPRHLFCVVMDMSIGTIQSIENEGKELDENFKILLRAKYKK